MTESFRFRTRSGREILLVPGHAVRPLDDGANGWRARALRAEPRGASAIMRARQDVWSTSRDLVAVDLGIASAPGRAVWGPGCDHVDWDDIPMLSDLRRPSDRAGGGDVPARPPPPGSILDPTATPTGPTAPETPPAPHFDVAPGSVEYDDKEADDAASAENKTSVGGRMTISGWDFDARVFLPVDTSSPTRTEPLDIVARASLYCRLHPDSRIVVVGHSDPSGAAAFNDALSAIRAKSVYLYLRREREAWSQLAAEQSTGHELQLALAWLAAFCGVPCHPGAIDGDAGPKTLQALHALRFLAGVADDEAPAGDACIATAADWGLIFDAYEVWVHSTLGLASDAAVNAARVPAVSWIPCGERRPASDGRHRRVDLLFFHEPELPAPDMDAVAIHDIYEIHDITVDFQPESAVPYTGIARKAAERAIVWLRRTPFALISTHVWARHIRQLAEFAGKSWFARGTNVKKLVEKTLSNADQVTDQGARIVFEKQFAKAIGTRGETVLRVVVVKASGRIKTAFPSLQFKALTHPLAAVLATTTATNIQGRFAAYLSEQERLEESREGWFEFAADIAVGGSATTVRDEDYVIFRQIVAEELASGRQTFEESVRREDGDYRTMNDDEIAEFDQSVVQEIEAFDAWGAGTDDETEQE